MTRTLVARLDSVGDVLLGGPATRAVAGDPAAGRSVVFLCGPTGASAARLLPGVAEVLVWDAPWISASGREMTQAHAARLIEMVATADVDEAVILTSFHQSPLPLAMLLRFAGVSRIAGASVDHAGTLLDTRLVPGESLPEDLPEPERALRIAAAAGYELPSGDDGRLRVELPADTSTADAYDVVVHPGASAPARRWTVDGYRETVRLLRERGLSVAVTGSDAERSLTSAVAVAGAADLGGDTELATLGALLRSARVVVCANTGPAHLAAAVGTPVVSLFAPVVPAVRWRPYGVPHLLLGDQDAPCRGTRARECPVPGHPCLSHVRATDVAAAVSRLLGESPKEANDAHLALACARRMD